jgi:hypothetical protein
MTIRTRGREKEKEEEEWKNKLIKTMRTREKYWQD